MLQNFANCSDYSYFCLLPDVFPPIFNTKSTFCLEFLELDACELICLVNAWFWCEISVNELYRKFWVIRVQISTVALSIMIHFNPLQNFWHPNFLYFAHQINNPEIFYAPHLSDQWWNVVKQRKFFRLMFNKCWSHWRVKNLLYDYKSVCTLDCQHFLWGSLHTVVGGCILVFERLELRFCFWAGMLCASWDSVMMFYYRWQNFELHSGPK